MAVTGSYSTRKLHDGTSQPWHAAQWLARAVAICCLFAVGASADEHDSQFLAALRGRRLFELAERYARERIDVSQHSPSEQADLTVELVRTLAEHALHAPPDERPQRWLEARRAASSFLAAAPDNPRGILVRVQDSLTLLARGEAARQENDVGLLATEDQERALGALREASTLLEQIDKELTREIPLRRRVPPPPGALSAEELFSLHQHVRRQMSAVLRNRAMLYEAGSADRLSLLLSASQVLEDLLRELAGDDALAPPTQLELGICQRLLGETDTARRLLTALDHNAQPAVIRQQARAELIRLELSAGRRGAAEALLAELPSELAAADLDLARLEIELHRLRSLAVDAAAGKRREMESQIETLARQITETHGPFWGRRADQLVAGAVAQTGGAASADILSRAADSLYLKGEFDQAIASYEQAAAKATAAADPKAAFALRYKAAQVQQGRGLHADAARRLRELALTLRTHEQAAAAHLLAAWNAAQEARTSAEALTLYDDILTEHGSIWPRGDSRAQVQLWLGRLREAQGRWLEGARAYSEVPSESQHFPAALAGAAKTWKAAFRAQQTAGEMDQEQLRAALTYFESAAGIEPPGSKPLSESERLGAITAAELALDFGEQQHARAESLLRAALARAADAPENWRSRAKIRLIVALAAQGEKQREATRLLAEAGEASPTDLLEMASGLADVAEQASPTERPAAAKLLLEASELLERQRGELDRDSQRQLDRMRLTGLATAGREQAALELAARLADENPDRAEIQERYATLLLESGERAALEKGLGEWRTIAARSKPRTERWYRAKYSVALAQFKLGDVAPATTLLRYMLETPPGLKGTDWEARFEALLAQCRQAKQP